MPNDIGRGEAHRLWFSSSGEVCSSLPALFCVACSVSHCATASDVANCAISVCGLCAFVGGLSLRVWHCRQHRLSDRVCACVCVLARWMALQEKSGKLVGSLEGDERQAWWDHQKSLALSLEHTDAAAGDGSATATAGAADTATAGATDTA